MIHRTALVECDVPSDCEIGPMAVIGPQVRLSPRVRIGAHAVVDGRTSLGEDVRVGPNSVIGTEPQDLKYAGEPTELVVGARTNIREFANINRGTAATGVTIVGSDCLVMAYAHIAHDCRIGNGVILANCVNLAGHVEVGDFATIGGVVPVHQFVRIGAYSMIGGGYRVALDVPPFCLAGGYPMRVASLNRIGLSRRGFKGPRLDDLERAFRFLFREPGSTKKKAARMLEEEGWGDDSLELARFINSGTRGVVG
jgi:UDP-N-acetylglucosamine acyltransferase